MCVTRKRSECLPVFVMTWLYFSGVAGVDRDTHQPHHEGRGHQGLLWDCPRTQQRHRGGCRQHLHVCLLPGETRRRSCVQTAVFGSRNSRSRVNSLLNTWVCIVHLLLSAHWLWELISACIQPPNTWMVGQVHVPMSPTSDFSHNTHRQWKNCCFSINYLYFQLC